MNEELRSQYVLADVKRHLAEKVWEMRTFSSGEPYRSVNTDALDLLLKVIECEVLSVSTDLECEIITEEFIQNKKKIWKKRMEAQDEASNV